MGITTSDLGVQASHVLDRAAITGRGLAETGQGLLDTAGGLIGASAGLVELAGTLVAEAGELAGEAGERLVRASENVAEVVSETASEHLPGVRNRARQAGQNRLLVALLGVTIVALLLAMRRRRSRTSAEARLDKVTFVSEPDTHPVSG